MERLKSADFPGARDFWKLKTRIMGWFALFVKKEILIPEEPQIVKALGRLKYYTE
ncbi:MAG: hypothetical protein WCE94_14340 [Candidatus Methanoperedens sp.]